MKVILSGIAGFIGAHTARALLDRGDTVVGFDNLSRRGGGENLAWLRSRDGDLRFVHADLRSWTDVEHVLAAHADADGVIHLGGQVAVTSSVANPRMDFEANALGTLNLLEAVRLHAPRAAFLYAYTNKVYGGMEEARVVLEGERYGWEAFPDGIPETTPLDFHSPYGCSKGAADQYVRDYARIYGLNTLVFRQSCIYGTRQFGIEDQGWVAWFTIAATLGRPATIFGDGRQVRDVLWIDDLVRLYLLGLERAERFRGSIFNVGGGPANRLSIMELVQMLRESVNPGFEPSFASWRPGDQRVFVADVRQARELLGWEPRTRPLEGVRRLVAWTRENREMLREVLG